MIFKISYYTAVEIKKYLIKFIGKEKNLHMYVFEGIMIHVQDRWHTDFHGTLRHSCTSHTHTLRGQSRSSAKQRISMKNTENRLDF